jgi:Big-like domain-containing protein
MASTNPRSKIFLVSAIFVMACGEDSPVSPGDTAAAVHLSIAGPSTVFTGNTAKYDATATLSNGMTLTQAAAAWNVDDAGVAMIDSTGLLRGLRPGRATITALFRAATATTSVEVLAKPASQPAPARANIVISYNPNPVVASFSSCPDERATPTWRYSLTISETGGVGFNLKTYTWDLFNESGTQVYGGPFSEEEYFPPNSVTVEEVCHSLLGQTSGTAHDTMDGVDDNGNQLTFSNQLRLLPVGSTSSLSTLMTPNRISRTIVGALRQVR